MITNLQVVEFGGPVYCLAWDEKQRQLVAGGRGAIQFLKVLRPSSNYIQTNSEKKANAYVCVLYMHIHTHIHVMRHLLYNMILYYSGNSIIFVCIVLFSRVIWDVTIHNLSTLPKLVGACKLATSWQPCWPFEFQW